MGLNDEEVVLSRNKYGSNSLSKTNKNTFFKLLIESLGDPIIKILVLALIIKVVFLFSSFDWFETIGILIAIFLATMISALSEYGSESAFNKLQESNDNLLVKVKRNKIVTTINIDGVVVNDIILLSSGDKVPADGVLISGNLNLDESSLNGESKEAKKCSLIGKDILNKNKVYRGSVVCSGSADVKIISVGDNTVYGSISREVQEKTIPSPLKLRLRKLAKSISKLGYLGAFLVSFSYLFSNIVINNNFDITLILNTLTNFHEMADHLIYALTLSVTIIVVAVPEGLPMMITLVLSSNMRKMLKDNVLVRKMVGVETAGSLNLLLTDKTGTLTKGLLEVTSITSFDNFKVKSYKELYKYSEYEKLIYYSLYYNNECLCAADDIIGGNLTDKALIKFVDVRCKKVKVLRRELFDSDKKYSSVLLNDGNSYHLIKGAPEVILSKCSSYYNKYGEVKNIVNNKYLYNMVSNMTKRGNRVIVLAEVKDESYIFIGLVSIKDELRSETKETIKLIKNAGINVIMITGDNIDTARVIGYDSGIVNSTSDIVMDSNYFNSLSNEEVIDKLPNIKVIARALPSDKSRLVKLAQSKGLVVGMTGDGVNDAPALKKADVGFAMGSGTDVAKEASDIVILDDNIKSISKAVLYGRTIFKSIRKFIIFQLSINVCALIISIVGSLIGINEPITIIQMLWLNMIMDTFAGLAFSFEPPLLEYMEEKPKNKEEPILNNYMLSQIIFGGVYSSIICLLFLKLPIVSNYFRTGLNNIYLYTAYFALFIFLGVFNAFNARTTRINILAYITKNKVFVLIFSFIVIVQLFIIYKGGYLFRTFGLTINELLIIFIISFTIIPLDILRKIILKKKDIQKSL